MTDQPSPLTAGAMTIRSPLLRQRPWVSDDVWIAHESLQLFDRLAGLMPRNGWWRLTAADGEMGAEFEPERPGTDLVALVERLAATAQPCVVAHDDYQWSDSRESAMAVSGTQTLEVLDGDLARWEFDHDLLAPLVHTNTDWTWKLAPHARSAALVAFDRKDRPRYVLMSKAR